MMLMVMTVAGTMAWMGTCTAKLVTQQSGVLYSQQPIRSDYDCARGNRLLAQHTSAIDNFTSWVVSLRCELYVRAQGNEWISCAQTTCSEP
jgi:hypothetical protein